MLLGVGAILLQVRRFRTSGKLSTRCSSRRFRVKKAQQFVAARSTSSRPGDPTAHMIFVFAFAKMYRDVVVQLEHLLLLPEVGVNVFGIEPCGAREGLISIPFERK